MGVLSGRDGDPSLIREWVNQAEEIWAADGGADLVLEAGRRPDAIIGDFDSVSAECRALDIPFYEDADQNRSDCEKLLGFLHARGVRIATLIGVEGDRPDHELAILAAAAQSNVAVRLAYRRGIGFVLNRPVTYRLETRPGQVISLLPLVPSEVHYTFGLRWDFGAKELSSLGLVSLSNEATGEFVEIGFGAGAALLFQEFGREDLPRW